MTAEEIDALTDAIAEAIRMATDPLRARIAKLEVDRDIDRAQIAELKARPVVKEFRGTWLADVTYEKRDRVSAAGGSWIALTDSKGRKPSETASAWFLEVRSGRDGRDGKDLR